MFIEKNLTLTGTEAPTAAKLIGSAPQRTGDAVLTIGSRINVTVRNIAISGGRTTGRVGGGISNFGTLRLEQVKVTDCNNIGLGAGGILNLGGSAKLVAEDVEVAFNAAVNTNGGGDHATRVGQSRCAAATSPKIPRKATAAGSRTRAEGC